MKKMVYGLPKITIPYKLKAQKNSNHFWGKATSIVVYIINICPIMKLHNKTPYEAWSGLKPSVGL